MWFNLSPSIAIVNDLKNCDLLIIGSPHGIHLQDHRRAPEKIFIFLQMLEHLFRPADRAWVELCRKFYTSPHPMILLSFWNYEWLVEKYNRTGVTFYVGNGVNTKDFPIRAGHKNTKTILMESPITTNPTKDVDRIGLRVATRLRKEGYVIIGYGRTPCPADIFTSFIERPTADEMNVMYSVARILLKATRYDARSTSPMEAMTKACVTVRAIELGDDDLINQINCLRGSYDEESLYYNAKAVLTDDDIRQTLAENCLDYVEKFSWDYWFPKIEAILTGHPDRVESLLQQNVKANG